MISRKKIRYLIKWQLLCIFTVLKNECFTPTSNFFLHVQLFSNEETHWQFTLLTFPANVTFFAFNTLFKKILFYSFIKKRNLLCFHFSGDYCKPCECNGNINVSDPDSCDRFSGLCQKCLEHTFGDMCERCENWYYGDAVQLKNCQGKENIFSDLM